jgi:hypothetical protein
MERTEGEVTLPAAHTVSSISKPGPFNCPACQQTGEGDHCIHCGEDMHPERITLRYILRQISELYLGFETSRLLRTFRDLMLRPGQTLRTYFAGNRSNYYNPLDYLLLMVGFDIFILLWIYGSMNIQPLAVPQDVTGDGGLISSLGKDPGAAVNMIYLVQLPLFALATWLRNMRGPYTLGEHIYACAFIFGQVFACHILIMILLKIIPSYTVRMIMTYLWAIFSVGYITYAYTKWKHADKGFSRMLLTMIFIIPLYFVTFFIATLLTLFIRMAYDAVTGSS